MAPEIEELTERMGRLERENWRLKLIGMGLMVVLIGLVSVGLGGKLRTIEAEKIVLLDRQGRTRVTIGTPEVAGAAVDMKPGAPAIWLSDESGTDRAILTADGLRFGNGRAKPLIELSSDPRPGRSELRFYSPDGKVSWSAP